MGLGFRRTRPLVHFQRRGQGILSPGPVCLLFPLPGGRVCVFWPLTKPRTLAACKQ